jgi:hypothetical protein
MHPARTAAGSPERRSETVIYAVAGSNVSREKAPTATSLSFTGLETLSRFPRAVLMASSSTEHLEAKMNALELTVR